MTEKSGPPAKNEDGLPEVLAIVGAAQNAYLQAWNSYDEEGPPLEETVLRQLAPYHDLAQDRARLIQAFARDLSQQIQAFTDVRHSQLSKMAGVCASYVSTMSQLRTEGLQSAFDRVNAMLAETQRKLAKHSETHLGVLEDDADSVQAVVTRQTELQQATQSVAEGMAWAFGVATHMIALRQDDLDAYLKRVPLVDRTAAIRGALLSAILEEAALRGMEYGVNAVALGVPVGTALASIAAIGQRVREKVKTMNAHYERGALDEMFEFAQAIDDETQIHVAVNEMLDVAAAFFDAVRAQF